LPEAPGVSVFFRERDDVFHTYSTYGRGPMRTDVVHFDGRFLTCGEELSTNLDVTF
jgi:hypothetical protein